MKFLKFNVSIVFPLLLMITGLLTCRPKIKTLKSPPHYNFSEVVTHKLDLKIKEISGIVWDRVNDEFIAHNDETGKIFYLDKGAPEIIKKEFQFAGKGDYEDIALINGIPYVLRSDGLITKIIKDSTGRQYGVEAGKIGLSGTNDFETMYYDETRKALVIICKNCAKDNKSTVSAFAFYPDSSGFEEKPLFTIDADAVQRLSSGKTSKLQPSAAAIHPVLKRLFILSSASNQLVIADTDGNVESVFVLSKKLFTQPEGITFKHNGEMYISNEGITTKSTLLRFLYKL